MKMLNYILINIIYRSTEGFYNHYYRKTFIIKNNKSPYAKVFDTILYYNNKKKIS